LSRGSSPSGYPAEPLVSFQINRQLSGWNPPPLVIRAFGAHGQKMDFDPNALDLLVIEQLSATLEKEIPRIVEEIEAFGPVALVVVDTSAAIFPGDDENNKAFDQQSAPGTRVLPGVNSQLLHGSPPYGKAYAITRKRSDIGNRQQTQVPQPGSSAVPLLLGVHVEPRQGLRACFTAVRLWLRLVQFGMARIAAENLQSRDSIGPPRPALKGGPLPFERSHLMGPG
jgi:hypothetical protein